MHVETLIYVYLAICTAMIAYNCVCIVYFRHRDASQRKRSTRLATRIAQQTEALRAGGELAEDHVEYLGKKLVRINNLMVLDETLSVLAEYDPDAVQRYIEGVRPVFARLASSNPYRNPMHRAFFAYVVTKHRIVSHDGPAAVVQMMFELLADASLYCRENALQALYATGDRAVVLRAMRVIDQDGYFHHRKLIVDGLLAFAGDRRELAEVLWGEFESFSTEMQAVVLDFIRFSGCEMPDEMLSLLVDDDRDDELRFACIRYFWKRPDERAYPLLLALLKNQEGDRWEYAAIAATALSAYPGERTIVALKRAMGSPNWYVRLNASKSLEEFNLTYEDLGDVMDGGDRYAREILQYQLDMKRAREGGEVQERVAASQERAAALQEGTSIQKERAAVRQEVTGP